MMNAAMDAQVNELAEILRQSERIVFFGGAGVSTESGLPDFRSESGRKATLEAFGMPPETILSADFFWSDPSTFYRYVKEFLYRPDAKPNAAHRALVRLEEAGKLLAIITQNIDGLHQLAGSRTVWELHGSLRVFRCVDCSRSYSMEEAVQQISEAAEPPVCECGNLLKPDVVLYQEGLPERALAEAAAAVQSADTLIVAGTSLAVYPAAGLVPLFTGKHLVVINLSETPADRGASLVIHEPVGQVLEIAVREAGY